MESLTRRYASSLDFEIVVDNITVGDFVNNPNSWLFVSDICTNVVASNDTCGAGGLTGDVVNGTSGIVTTPLPAGLVLFLVPVLGGAYLMRRCADAKNTRLPHRNRAGGLMPEFWQEPA